MATPSKTAQTDLLAWQDVSTANTPVGSSLDVSGKFEIGIRIAVGRRSGTAFTSPWPEVRIEGSPKASGTHYFATIFPFVPNIGASIANTTLNGAVSAGASSFVVSSATNIAAGDILFLGDSSTSNYEIVRVKSVSGTTITPEENIVNAHANGAIVTDQAETFIGAFDVSAYSRVRAVCANHSGQSISVEVNVMTLDSVS